MSKFLTQSKTFIPMVMQKSTTDAIQILERYPALSTAQHEELPKPDNQKEEIPKQETLNQETSKMLKQDVPKQDMTKQEILKLEPLKQNPPKLEPIHKDILKQISSASKENIKIVINKSADFPSVHSHKVLEANKIPVADQNHPAPVTKKNLNSLNVVTSTLGDEHRKTVLRALILDLVQLQRWLMVLLSEGQLWVWLRVLGTRMSSGASGAFRAEHRQPKEREPVLLSVPQKKTESKPKQDEKTEEKNPFRSNLWEAVQENSPAWQESISKKLGQWQKVAEEKFAK